MGGIGWEILRSKIGYIEILKKNCILLNKENKEKLTAALMYVYTIWEKSYKNVNISQRRFRFLVHEKTALYVELIWSIHTIKAVELLM